MRTRSPFRTVSSSAESGFAARYGLTANTANCGSAPWDTVGAIVPAEYLDDPNFRVATPRAPLDAGLTVKLIFSTSRFPSRASLRCWSMGMTARGLLVRIGNHDPGDAVLTRSTLC